MSRRELDRLQILQNVEEGQLTLKEAAEEMRVSGDIHDRYPSRRK